MTSSGEIRVCIIHSRAPNDNYVSEKIQQGLLKEGNGKFQVIDYDSNPTRDILQYDWIVLVRTPEALKDPKVCKVIDNALNLVTQRAGSGTMLQNIIALGVGPTDEIAERWPTIRTYNAGRDPAHLENYSEAFEKMVKTLSHARAHAPEIMHGGGSHREASPESQSVEMSTGWRPRNSSKGPYQYPLPDQTQPMAKDGSPAGHSSSSHPSSSQGVQSFWKNPMIVASLITALVVILIVSGAGAYLLVVLHTSSHGATSTAQPKATPTATIQGTPAPADLYNKVTKKTPDQTYTFSSNPNANGWQEVDGQCTLVNGAYQVTNTQPGQYTTCMGTSTTLGDFAYQVKMVINSGYAGGIIWRSNTNVNVTTFYRFSLGRDGAYGLYVCSSASPCPDKTIGTGAPLVNNGQLASPVGGSPPTAKLTVIAKGNTFYLYVNRNFITSAQDASISSPGEVGVYAASLQDQNTTVTFSELKVWSSLQPS